MTKKGERTIFYADLVNGIQKYGRQKKAAYKPNKEYSKQVIKNKTRTWQQNIAEAITK
jgi:hypothetical protein